MTFGKVMGYWCWSSLFELQWIPELPPFELSLHDAYGVELTGQPGYARVEVLPTAFSIPIAGMVYNTVEIPFPVATSAWSQPVSQWALWTQSTDPQIDILMKNDLDGDYFIQTGQRPTFQIGALLVIIDGAGLGDRFTRYAENELLERFLGRTPHNPPTYIWVGLLTGDPGDDATNTNCNEVPHVGTSYARVPTLGSQWALSTGKDCYNLVTITFPEAEESWGTVTHFGIFDVGAPTLPGHILLSGLLYPAREVGIGCVPRFVPTTFVDMGIDMAFLPDSWE